jgi:hypothetical protein
MAEARDPGTDSQQGKNMKNRNPRIILALAVACALVAPATRAETSSDHGSGALSAASHLDISVVVPRFLRFRVGTAGATIDQITFTVPGANVGDATPVAGTGGDAGSGSAASVSIIGNGGQITITESNNSGGAGLQHATLADTIAYTSITTTSSDPNLNAPTLSNAGGGTSTPVLNTTNITNRAAVWTYAYTNTAVVSAGTYGTSAKGGRVSYTATMP